MSDDRPAPSILEPGDCLMINGGFGCVTAVVGGVALIRMQNGSTGRMSAHLAAYLVEEFRRDVHEVGEEET